MIFTTTDIKRSYNVVDIDIVDGDSAGNALIDFEKDVKHYYPKADAVVGIRMFYSPLVDGEQYNVYGTVVQFKNNK